MDQDQYDQYIDGLRKLPARPWLVENRNENALASNRFGPTTKAVEFVEGLFSAGAVEVYIADPMEEPQRLKLEGGPYAETLIVSMPDDRNARAELFQIFAAEAERQGDDPPIDLGQTQVLLWWD